MLAGRLVSALIAAGLVVVVGLIGRQLSGCAAGLLAALLVAVVPLSVQTTTVLRNDPAQVLLVCAAVHASLAAASTDRRVWFVLAGLFGGAATAIKYTSVFALLPRIDGSLRSGSASLRATRAGLVLLAFVLTVAITNHFLWWDFPNFVEQLSDQIGITGPGHWAAVQNPAAFHTDILAPIRRRLGSAGACGRFRRLRAGHGPPARVGVLDVCAALQLVCDQAPVAVSPLGLPPFALRGHRRRGRARRTAVAASGMDRAGRLVGGVQPWDWRRSLWCSSRPSVSRCGTGW